MNIRFWTRAILPLALMAMTGCATVERGTTQQIAVFSEPSGALVETSHCGTRKESGLRTPATIEVSRRATQCTIHLWKEGYEEVTAQLQRRFDPSGPIVVAEVVTTNDFISSIAFWGAVLIGGLAVDSATGAVYVIEPDEIVVRLYPERETERWEEWRE